MTMAETSSKAAKKAARGIKTIGNGDVVVKKRKLNVKASTKALHPQADPTTTAAKKQRLAQVSAIAKDVIINLLSEKLNYEVEDHEWEKLVEMTQAHPKFNKLFNFPSDQPGWQVTKAKKKPTHLKIVALDCEMCSTQPLTDGLGGPTVSALCRVSAVNGEDMIRDICADLIVHQPEPGFRMIDPKTRIHGITEEMIAQSKITITKAQKHMLKYISSDTIVVGHSVHGDLSALRIAHRRVIDTALIFQRMHGDVNRSTPGLKDLTKFLLKFEMPDGHDSSIDAQASMLAAKYAVRHEYGRIIPSSAELHGPPAPVSNETPAGSTAMVQTGPLSGLSAARSTRLRLHRIPKGITNLDIENLFTQQAKVVPVLVEQIKWLPNQSRGSSEVTFLSTTHAGLAFDSIACSDEKEGLSHDSAARLQKTIAIVNSKGKTFSKVRLCVL